MATNDQPSGGGRYASFGPTNRQNLEAVMASIETTLAGHSKTIDKMADRMESIGETLTGIQAQMSHLVTKEACSEGRRELAEDLKARMDGDREITGVGITVPKLWQQYAEATRAQDHQAPAASSRAATSTAPSPARTTIYYVKAVSSIVSLVFAVITITFFAYRMMDRLDQQQTAMQQQQAVMRQIEGSIKRIQTDEEQSQEMRDAGVSGVALVPQTKASPP